ncbi:type II secretion system F family protein (plasmid) [Paenibacillus cellulosilyticus]|nr:type II secretion system F family protein [Paenibacillus cellulosilyticus]
MASVTVKQQKAKRSSGRKIPFHEIAVWLGWSFQKSQQQQQMTDYTSYELSSKQFFGSMAVGIGFAFVLFYEFYQSLAAAIILAAVGVILPRFYRASLLAKRRDRLQLQFKDALYSVTSSLAAGRSVENAFVAAEADLQLLYPGGSADIVREFAAIRYRMMNGDTLENGLRQFADRARLEDLTQFVDVFSTCKRTGGDLVEVIRRTAQVIGEKLDTHQEITVMMAQKKFESRIIIIAPFVFVAGLNLMSPDYMMPLYNGLLGYLLLTGLMIGFAGCGVLINKIMTIRM